jgi:N-acetylglucosamine-6-phosphate deacetylase
MSFDLGWNYLNGIAGPGAAPDRYALHHCTLYTGEQVIDGHALVINGARIVDIVPEAQLPGDLPRLDGQGWAASPGFIDLQLNGCGGVMVNDAIAPATLEVMHRTNLRSGTTSFLPTLISASDEDMAAAIALVAAYGPRHPHRVLGLHLEGPYLNPRRGGIHSQAQIRPADPAMIQRLVQAGPSVVRLVTLAPERVEPQHLRQLADAGIVVAAGHTDASFEEGLASFAAGVTMATHLFNAMSPWQGRSPGMVGAVFHAPEVYAGIIVDGHHVHFGSVGLAQRLKQDRLVLVTDATAPVGTALASFRIGGQEVFYRQGRCVSADGTLGGAALTLMEAIANCVRQVGLPLAEALRMATLYPARAVRLDSCLGRLAPGYWANVTLFDPQGLRVQGVIEAGRPVWASLDAGQPALETGAR